MFDDLRAAFKEALENFNKELNRDQVSEAADKLLIGMKNEIVDEKAAVAGLEEQVEKTRGQIERLTREAETARRRQEMARRIDDDETVELAETYADKVEGHLDVLKKKLSALEEELTFRKGTVEEMFARFEEAKEKRASLKATTGRTSARETISAANDLFSELDRMAEKIEDRGAQADAAREIDELDLEGASDLEIDLEHEIEEEVDVDAALAELKRRMKERDG